MALEEIRARVRVLRPLLIAAFVALYLVVGAAPSWKAVSRSDSARDYATYHYAVQQAWEGGDPYETRGLSKRARDEGTRKSVHPYFYPPPFLAGMLWAVPLDLKTAYQGSFWINQVSLLGLGFVFWRWLRAPWLLLAFLLATFSPIPDSAKMGQANLVVLLLASLGLWRSNGWLLSAAAMAKMSPALYLVQFALRRSWKVVGTAVAGAVLSSVAVLWLVPFDTQWTFYTEILPGFSKGDYHGLRVPITLPANHSVADLYNQLFGPGKFSLPPAAALATSLTNLALLAGVAWLGRHRRDTLGEAGLAGALTVLLTIAPVYTYEHHLVLLVLPFAVVGTAWLQGRLPRWGLAVLLPTYALVAQPLGALRQLQKQAPEELSWFFQESKFFGELGLLALCLWVLLASPRLRSPETASAPAS